MIRREDRLSRRPWPTGERTTLDANNARWSVSKEPRTLHPTKGWRKVNPKLTLASTIVGMVKQGKMRFATSEIKRALQIAGEAKFNG